MEIPPIPLRRSPKIALAILIVGLAVAGLGIFFAELWVTFLGVLPVLLAGMLMLNPMVVLSDKEVALKNIFGLTRARYDHDGLHLVQITNDVIFIQKGDMRAPLRRIVKGRLHGGDWAVMLVTLDKVRAMREHLAKGKPKR